MIWKLLQSGIRMCLVSKIIFTLQGLVGGLAFFHLRCLKYADLCLWPLQVAKNLLDPKAVGVSLNFSMFDRFDASVDTLAEQARKLGANIVSGLLDRPWNVRELMILDPDGYQLVFSAPLNTNLGFDEVVKKAASQK